MINAEAMNSVTPKKRRRRSILTKDLMTGIPVLVQQGLNAEAIAARLGCTVGTLKVRCSQQRISLRVPKQAKVVPLVPLVPASPGRPPQSKQCFAFAMPTTLQISRVAMSRLRQRAEAIGVNEAQLASDLLEVIAQDDLYDAVLDNKAKKICA
ncbi:MAG: hypothetical protein WBG10_01820 [Pseudolabrys sp.]